MKATPHFILLILAILLGSPPPVLAFDDDSTDDSRSLLEVRTICDDGRNVIDTQTHKSSCQNDDVYVTRRRTALFKNGVKIARELILDFKISRGGRVYYRTEAGPFLYNENGKLNSHGGRVLFYLVASSGDVIYMNEDGDLFKNGTELDRGPARITVKETKANILGLLTPLFLNPVISRNGKAVYVNQVGRLFVDGKRINPRVSQVRTFKLNSTGDVYYIDDAGKLYRNKKRLFDGSSNILEFQLNNQGEVVYLTNLPTKNLFFEDRVMAAGAHRIVRFGFNANGDVLYTDDIDRLWIKGRLIAK